MALAASAGQEDRGEDEDEASQGDGGAGELDGGKQDEPVRADRSGLVQAGRCVALAEEQPSADHGHGQADDHQD
jgi:hypothetical protein